MASNSLGLIPKLIFPSSKNKILFKTSFISIQNQTKISTQLQSSSKRPLALTITSHYSSQELPFKTPSTREEAISQAKLCLSTTLQKPLNNYSTPLQTKKLKKPRQPRFRVEIPVVDDSPDSVSKLAFDIFAKLNVSKKGSKPRTLIIWSSVKQLESAQKVFNSVNSVVNSTPSSLTFESLSSTDLTVILAPRKTDIQKIKTVTETLSPKPVVLFNPQWSFDEEAEFDDETQSFVGSFEVVYSFMGLEVRGVLNKRQGAVLRCVMDGVMSGDGWVVMVDYNNNGEMKVVTKFKKRPAMAEVESVLYNVMAANSPVTKSVKFLSDLVSNVTGRKGKK